MPSWLNIRQVENFRRLDDVREVSSVAIQSQYSASPKIVRLMQLYLKWLSVYKNIDTFYDNVFNIFTATSYGLNIWGDIVNISRIIDVTNDDGSVSSVTLEDDDYRALILYKALANISAATPLSLNTLLNALIQTNVGNFPARGYVLEVDVMVIRWVFEDYLTPLQRAIFLAAGILAKGAGVGWELYAVNPEQVFGFDGSDLQPFNQAPFAPDNALVIGGN